MVQELFLAVLLRMSLGCFRSMKLCISLMAVRGVGVMGCLLVLPSIVVFRGGLMVFRGLFVMMRRLTMMLCCLFRH
jgi:hypothetical protein